MSMACIDEVITLTALMCVGGGIVHPGMHHPLACITPCNIHTSSPCSSHRHSTRSAFSLAL